MAKYNKPIPFKKAYGKSSRLGLVTGSQGIQDARRRTSGRTITPDLNTSVPPVETTINMVYDYDGSYLGWTKNPEAIKWTYGLSYKTGKRYKVMTDKYVNDPLGRNPYGTSNRLIVYDESTREVAMVVWTRRLAPEDLIEQHDILAQIEVSKNKLEDLQIVSNSSGVVIRGLEDPYGLIKDYLEQERKGWFDQQITDIEHDAVALEMEMMKKVQEIRDKKKPLINKFKNDILTSLDKLAASAKSLKTASEETGIDLDI